MNDRGLRGFLTGPGLGILAIAGLLAGATPAFGGVANTIKVVVTPIEPGNVSPPNATYSDPATNFKGFIGYRVDIKNEGRNTSNHVKFRAEAYVTDPAELATFAFDSSEGAVCSPTASPPPGRIQIQCDLGQLKSGQVVPTFSIFFKTPQKVINGDADGTGLEDKDFVNLFYEVLYAEGKNGPKSKPQNGFTPLIQALPDFVLGTPDPTLVRSVVLKTGGSFATGNDGVANNLPSTNLLSDQFAVKSVVPPLTGAAFTTVQIEESAPACHPISPNVKTCYGADFTIPGTFAARPFLTNSFSMAIENVKKVLVCPPRVSANPKMMNTTFVPVTYNCTEQLAPIGAISFDYVPDGSTTVFPVLACAQAGVPNPPVNGQDVPCINKRTVFKKLNKPIRYDWTFISVKNGRIITLR